MSRSSSTAMLTVFLTCVFCTTVHAQSHGVQIVASCESPVYRGQTLSCSSALYNDDDFGDTVEVTEAFAIVNPDGDFTRVPAVGNLPVCELTGNAFAAGSPYPLYLGVANSTLSGLPGDPLDGCVEVCLDTYIVQPDDPDILIISFNWVVADLCDEPTTMGCFTFPGVVQFTAAVQVLDCPGDTNADAEVDVNDINNVILDWGTDGSANGGDVAGALPGDPPDGIVNVNDLVAVITGWGTCE